jgi:hypothetical protein
MAGLIKGIVKVELVNEGDGINGKYDPSNSKDMQFLRMYISADYGKGFEQLTSNSTLFPAKSMQKEQEQAVKLVMDVVYKDVSNADPFRPAPRKFSRLAHALSYVNPTWFTHFPAGKDILDTILALRI